MSAPILVTGGTGTLGRFVVPRLLESGRQIRVLSRQDNAREDGVELVNGDLATGNGVERAVEGAEVIIHLAGSSKGDDVKARNLIKAASRAGRPHVVYISVVGADTIPIVSGVDRAMFGYFGAKLAAERAVAESGLPWTTMRATQFHSLMLTTVRGMSKMPVIPVPAGFRFQPIDADEVAARLVEVALGRPAGLVPDIAGPHIYLMKELVRSYLAAHRKHRATLSIGLPGKAARAFRAGANLAPQRAVGRRTWEEFLGAEITSRGSEASSSALRSA